MTYDGSISSRPSKVKIPNANSIQLAAGTSISTGSLSQIWNDGRFLYWGGNPYIAISDIENPSAGNNAVTTNNTGGLYFHYIHPDPIDGFFYAFGNTDDLGSTPSTAIYRSTVANPTAFYFYGNIATALSGKPYCYVDATHIYLFGDGSYATTIQRATRAAPGTWTNVGNIGAGRKNGVMAVAGSTIVIYGGENSSFVATNTMQTASTSNPLSWSNVGATLPQAITYGAVYVDATNVYIYGPSGSDNDSIFRAPLGAPTTVTDVGTMVVGQGMYAYTKNNKIYIITQSASAVTASTSTPLTTTALNQLSQPVAGAAVGIHNGNIYLIGGKNSGGTNVNTIQVASTTTPSTFVVSGNTMPATIYGGQIVKTSQYFYLIGGNGNTGSVYRASLSAPTVWTLVNTSGPARINGRAFFYKNVLYYLGGETTPGSVSVANTSRTTIINGEVTNWTLNNGLHFQGGSFPALARFSLVIAGDYIYALGGHIQGVLNQDIYRARLSNLHRSSPSSWDWGTGIGTITTGFVDQIPAIIGNRVYLYGGGSSASTVDDQVYSASIDDLANGIANWTLNTNAVTSSEFNILPGNMAEGNAVFVNDDLYIYGVRTTNANGTQGIYKTNSAAEYYLLQPNSAQRGAPMPVIDPSTGALGVYSAHQRTGMLPWLVTEF